MSSFRSSQTLPLNPTSSSIKSGVNNNSSQLPQKNINFRDELINYFIHNMLNTIVDSWEPCSTIEKICSISSCGIETRDHEQNEEVLEAVSDESFEPINFAASSGHYKIEDNEVEIRSKNYDARESVMDFRKKKKTYTRKKSSKRSMKSSKKILGQMESRTSGIQKTDAPIEEVDRWIIEPINCKAVVHFHNGNVYEGDVYGNFMHGFGKFYWTDGTTYIGDFEYNTMTGKGEIIFSDQSSYKGELYENYRHGEGTMLVKSQGIVYRGSWYSGLRHGHGWQIFGNNNCYEGEWLNGQMSGIGLRQYEDCTRYRGHWLNGLRHGKGCAIFPNNDYFIGNWEDGHRCGYGEYIWNAFLNKTFTVPVQSHYCGAWLDNKKHGVGLINFGMEGGARFAGCFVENKKHGAGVLVCENGSSVQLNPLFMNDKPVHLKKDGSPDITEKELENMYVSNRISFLPTKREQSLYKMLLKEKSLSNLDPSMLANIEHTKLLFPHFEEKYLSLQIPINTPSELIVLDHYLIKVLDLTDIKIDIDSLTHNLENVTPEIRALLNNEERNLRNAITYHVRKLRSIYNQYSTITCLQSLPFKTLLIRLFLWQFYRDCKIPDKNLSLIELDMLMIDNLDVELERCHNPFEVIYFWQFLHSLVVVSLNLYGKAFRNRAGEILKLSFVSLLENDIYPNYGHHVGSVLFEYLNIFPLKVVYKWFESFPDNFTALDFLRYSCTIKKQNPPSYYIKKSIYKIVYLPNGYNACPVGEKFNYLEDEEEIIQTKPMSPKMKTQPDCLYYNLMFLRSLGAKTIVAIMSKICPGIIEMDEIVNMKYELTFLEFYEILLKCLQEIVDRKVRKEERLRNPKRSREMRKTQNGVFSSSSSVKEKKTNRLFKLSKKKLV